ncbi:hypothetical protein ACEPAI_8389 [Sanghuangporus weigelae]
MTTNTAQSKTSTRKSSRLAEKASQQVPSSSQRAHSSTSNSARTKRTRRNAKEKEHLPQRSNLTLAAKGRPRREKRKDKPVPSATHLDANDPEIANEPTCTDAERNQDPLIDLVKKRKKTITSSQRKTTRQQTLLDELPKEARSRFFTLQAKVKDSNREHERLSNANTLLRREVGKIRENFRKLAADIDDLKRKVEGLPPKHRLKVDPYGEPFRKCRQKVSSLDVFPDPAGTILSRLKEQALGNAGPASTESSQSGEGSSDETLTDQTPNRKRRRDESEETADEKIRTSGASACIGTKNDQIHKPESTASTPSDRSTKRIRFCDTEELTTRTREA